MALIHLLTMIVVGSHAALGSHLPKPPEFACVVVDPTTKRAWFADGRPAKGSQLDDFFKVAPARELHEYKSWSGKFAVIRVTSAHALPDVVDTMALDKSGVGQAGEVDSWGKGASKKARGFDLDLGAVKRSTKSLDLDFAYSTGPFATTSTYVAKDKRWIGVQPESFKFTDFSMLPDNPNIGVNITLPTGPRSVGVRMRAFDSKGKALNVWLASMGGASNQYSCFISREINGDKLPIALSDIGRLVVETRPFRSVQLRNVRMDPIRK